jgi:hypothetical protein
MRWLIVIVAIGIAVAGLLGMDFPAGYGRRADPFGPPAEQAQPVIGPDMAYSAVLDGALQRMREKQDGY